MILYNLTPDEMVRKYFTGGIYFLHFCADAVVAAAWNTVISKFRESNDGG